MVLDLFIETKHSFSLGTVHSPLNSEERIDFFINGQMTSNKTLDTEINQSGGKIVKIN